MIVHNTVQPRNPAESQARDEDIVTQKSGDFSCSFKTDHAQADPLLLIEDQRKIRRARRQPKEPEAAGPTHTHAHTNAPSSAFTPPPRSQQPSSSLQNYSSSSSNNQVKTSKTKSGSRSEHRSKSDTATVVDAHPSNAVVTRSFSNKRTRGRDREPRPLCDNSHALTTSAQHSPKYITEEFVSDPFLTKGLFETPQTVVRSSTPDSEAISRGIAMSGISYFFGCGGPSVPPAKQKLTEVARSSAPTPPADDRQSSDLLDVVFDGVEGFVCREGPDATPQGTRDPDIIDRIFEPVENATCRHPSEESQGAVNKDGTYEPDILDHIFDPVERAACRHPSVDETPSDDSGIVAAPSKDEHEVPREISREVPVVKGSPISPKKSSKEVPVIKTISTSPKKSSKIVSESPAWNLAERSSALMETTASMKSNESESVLLTYRPKRDSSEHSDAKNTSKPKDSEAKEPAKAEPPRTEAQENDVLDKVFDNVESMVCSPGQQEQPKLRRTPLSEEKYSEMILHPSWDDSSKFHRIESADSEEVRLMDRLAEIELEQARVREQLNEKKKSARARVAMAMKVRKQRMEQARQKQAMREMLESSAATTASKSAAPPPQRAATKSVESAQQPAATKPVASPQPKQRESQESEDVDALDFVFESVEGFVCAPNRR